MIKAIIPARMTSSRLSGKVLLDINGKSALQRMIERVKQAKLLDGIVIAITTNPQDDCLIDVCRTLNCEYYRGSEENVLDRIIQAAKYTETKTIVEMTSDCTLIDPRHIDLLISEHIKKGCDLTTNIETRSFFRGCDIRIVDTKTLEKVQNEVDNSVDEGHVLTWMYLNPKGKLNYSIHNIEAVGNLKRPDLDITLDTPEDLELIRWLFKAGEEYRLELTCEEVINLIDTYPEKYTKVAEIKRKDYFQELKEFYEKEQMKYESNDNRSRKSRVSK